MDVLAFTGGVGEHAADIRKQAVDGLGFLGVTLDGAVNATASDGARVEAATSAVAVVVLTAREDLEIARQVCDLLA